jgi:hypothetical protein
MSMTARCRAPAFGAPFSGRLFRRPPQVCPLGNGCRHARQPDESPPPLCPTLDRDPAVRQAAGHDPAALAVYGTDAAAAAAAAAQITMRFIKARDKADRDYGELQAGPFAAPHMLSRVLAGCTAALPGGRGGI